MVSGITWERISNVVLLFGTIQVPSFDSGFSKNEILKLIVFN
jgi:hypothetical protein